MAGHVAWPYYLTKFNELIKKYGLNKILKTDCNNEAFGNPKPGGLVMNLDDGEKLDITLLEYDKNVIKIALDKYPKLNIEHGDIRQLNYDSNSFDAVADFSTIDHVNKDDVFKVLNEYLRVTKNGGFIILVCWFSYDRKNLIENFSKWSSGDQYFLWEEDIINYFQRFPTKLIESETIVNVNYNTRPGWESIKIKDNPKYYLKYILFQKEST